MLAERILRFIENPASADPDELEELLEAARAAGDAASGDPGQSPIGLERAALERTLAEAIQTERLPVLALAAGPETPSSTSPSPMSPMSRTSQIPEYLLDHRGSSESLRAFGRRGVDIAAGRSWLAARQRDRKSALVVAPSGALSDLLQTLARRHLRFRLPPSSIVLDLVTPSEPWCPADLVGDSLGPAAALFRVYTPAGGLTPFLARDRGTGEPPLFSPPAWTRARIDGGDTGALTIFDLAAFESAGTVEIATGDQATATAYGFRLA